MGVREIDRVLEQWQMGVKDLPRRMILAPRPRERARRYAMLLLAQSLPRATTRGVDRGDHGGGAGPGPAHHRTVGRRRRRGRSRGIDFRAERWFPPALDPGQQEELKAAAKQPPAASGLGLANRCGQAAIRRGGFGRRVARPGPGQPFPPNTPAGSTWQKSNSAY